MSIHGSNSGKMKNASNSQNMKLNEIFLIDLILRLVSVLILERFCDFVSDAMMSPVKESSAQLLGTVLEFVSKEISLTTAALLLKLCESEVWEVRHGGLLGLKYLVVVVDDLPKDLVQHIFISSLRG